MNDEGLTQQASRTGPAAAGPWAQIEAIAAAARLAAQEGGRGPCPRPGPALPAGDALPAPAAAPAEWIDERTLARYAECPYQGWSAEVGLVQTGSPEADAGREVHRVLAGALRRYLDLGTPPAEGIGAEIASARPDVQHEVAAALAPSVRAIDAFVRRLRPEAILAARGGPLGRPGRLGRCLPPADAGGPGVVVTAEPDLLWAGAAAGEVHEIDFKSGRKVWTAGEVRGAFRFRLHAWLLFGRVGGLEACHARVWSTRFNARTAAVTFTRRDAASAEGMLRQAASRREMALAAFGRCASAGAGEAVGDAARQRREEFWWPGLARCASCAAAAECPAATGAARDFAADPERFARETLAVKAALARRMRVLRAAVRRQKRDLVFDDVAFGIDRPARAANPPADFYRSPGRDD